MATSVTHFPVSIPELTASPCMTTTEEVVSLPDGRKQRVIRTTQVILERGPDTPTHTHVKSVQRTQVQVTNTTQVRAQVARADTVDRSLENGYEPAQQRQKVNQAQASVPMRAKPGRLDSDSRDKKALHKGTALDIPYADESCQDLDVPMNLIPSSQNTPRLVRAASMKKKQVYSMTDASEDFTVSVQSPQIKIDKGGLHHQSSFSFAGPRVEKKPRPHSYHAGSHSNGGYYGSAGGYYGSFSSANSSFQEEPDGDVFSYEHTPVLMSTPRTDTTLSPTVNFRSGSTGPLSPTSPTSPNGEKFASRGSARTDSSGSLDGESRRYKQHSNKNASLNRAASLQLRAYKTKSLSAARTTSLCDDWMDNRTDLMTKKPVRTSARRRSWATGQFTLKECKTCGEKHTKVNGLLTFDEFHDYFFHTQWPAQTIMLCELKFFPSDKLIKLRVTSCNHLSQNKREDCAKHAEVFFCEFLQEKVIPNLIGGDLERLEINIWMNNSPCNQKTNRCCETLQESFEIIESIVEDSKMNIAFCHMSDLMNHQEPTRSSDLAGLVKLMSHPNISVRPFNGYDWLELLMIRTEQSERWLKLANSDLRSLIEERSDKDRETRAGLRQMVIDYQEEISSDITHLKKAMARINHI